MWWHRMSLSTKEEHTPGMLLLISFLISEWHGQLLATQRDDLSSTKAMRMLQSKPKSHWTMEWRLLHVLENNFKTEKMARQWKLLNNSSKLFCITVQILLNGEIWSLLMSQYGRLELGKLLHLRLRKKPIYKSETGLLKMFLKK